MNRQEIRLTFRGSIPWLLAAMLGCVSCVSARWVTETPPLVVADFDGCQRINNLGGEMGFAYKAPDSLVESYVEEEGRGCVARLAFAISEWSGFWLKLQSADLRPYQALRFDVRADPQPGIPGEMKVELKRRQGAEIVIAYVTDIGAKWQTVRVDLADFRPTGANPPLATREDVEELVFVFEAAKAGGKGVVYLDDIAFER